MKSLDGKTFLRVFFLYFRKVWAETIQKSMFIIRLKLLFSLGFSFNNHNSSNNRVCKAHFAVFWMRCTQRIANESTGGETRATANRRQHNKNMNYTHEGKKEEWAEQYCWICKKISSEVEFEDFEHINSLKTGKRSVWQISPVWWMVQRARRADIRDLGGETSILQKGMKQGREDNTNTCDVVIFIYQLVILVAIIIIISEKKKEMTNVSSHLTSQFCADRTRPC